MHKNPRDVCRLLILPGIGWIEDLRKHAMKCLKQGVYGTFADVIKAMQAISINPLRSEEEDVDDNYPSSPQTIAVPDCKDGYLLVTSDGPSFRLTNLTVGAS